MSHTIADNAAQTTFTANGLPDLTIAVVYIGSRSFRWTIVATDTITGQSESFTGDDLSCSAVGNVPDNNEMLQTLANFLTEDADRYQGSGNYGMTDPTDGYVFESSRIAELAYSYSDALAEIADTDD